MNEGVYIKPVRHLWQQSAIVRSGRFNVSLASHNTKVKVVSSSTVENLVEISWKISVIISLDDVSPLER